MEAVITLSDIQAIENEADILEEKAERKRELAQELRKILTSKNPNKNGHENTSASEDGNYGAKSNELVWLLKKQSNPHNFTVSDIVKLSEGMGRKPTLDGSFVANAFWKFETKKSLPGFKQIEKGVGRKPGRYSYTP